MHDSAIGDATILKGDEPKNNEVSDIAPLIEKIIAKNEGVSFGKIAFNDSERLVIQGLWKDRSVGILLPDGQGQVKTLLETINDLSFPQTLAAIYHHDLRSIEFIWSAFIPTPNGAEINGRTFDFRFQEITYPCRFAPCSEKLLALAENFIELGQSDTDYRNLRSFRSFVRSQIAPETERKNIFGSPRCFWLQGIDYDPELIEQIIDSLNFYLTYYDKHSPNILVHNESKKSFETTAIRYIHGSFPSKISAKPLDRNLTNFWAAAQTNDTAQSFLYSYRIMEYAGTNYIEAAPKQAIRKVLMSPHISDNIEQACTDVLAAINKSKMDDYTKFEAIIRLSVSPDILWSYIEKNFDAFCKKLEFDGGHTVPALVSGPESYKDFCNNGISTFASAIRKMRNALSHGKDEKQQQVILPTHKNAHHLAAWAELTRIAAGEVILFESC